MVADSSTKQASRSAWRIDGPAILLVMFGLDLGIGLHLTGVVARGHYASNNSLDDSIRFVTKITNATTGTTYLTIQEAIDKAASGDVIVLPPGRYTGDGDRDLDLHGKAITVHSIDPADDAIMAATVFDCQGTEKDRHRGFQFFSGEGLASVIAGLTVTHGYASLMKTDHYEFALGGGIVCCPKSSSTISNCRIIGNTASGEYSTTTPQPALPVGTPAITMSFIRIFPTWTVTAIQTSPFPLICRGSPALPTTRRHRISVILTKKDFPS